MRYSIEPKDRIYVKGYGFLSFDKSISNKECKKVVDSVKKSTTDATKTASKSANRAIQETAKATGDLIDNKIAGKITKASKELHSKNNSKTDKSELEIPKERKKTANY